jgi:uncharacterized protein CbrC (UPF0167 family)
MQVEISLTKDELNEAVCAWVEAKGFVATDRFTVTITQQPGDRPFDVGYTSISVTGVQTK